MPAADFLSALGVGTGTTSPGAGDVATDAAGNTYLAGAFTGTVDFDPANTPPGGADVLTSQGGADGFVAKYAPDNTLVWVTRMGGAGQDAASHIKLDGGGNVLVAGRFEGTARLGSVSPTSAGATDGFVTKLGPAGAVQWAKRWGVATATGTLAGDKPQGLGVDTSGNVYVVGSRFGGSTTAGNGVDVLKYRPDGRAEWAHFLNTRTGAPDGSLAVDAAGNVVVGGSFKGSVDFDPDPRKSKVVSAGKLTAAYVLKLTSAGRFTWVSNFVGQGSGSEAGYAMLDQVALDGTGAVVVSGSYGGLVDFDSGSGTATLPTAGGDYLAKLTAGGAYVWAQAWTQADPGPSSSVSPTRLTTDAAGSIYLAGVFSGSVDFDPGSGTHSRQNTLNAAGTAYSQDVFVLKLDSAGAFQWVETFGSAGRDFVNGFTVDASGVVHLSGCYQGTTDLDPDPLDTYELTSSGTGWSLFAVKLRQS